MVTVPCGVEELVSKPQDEDVLDHLLTKVVIDTEDLFLLPVGVQSFLKVAGALQILSERLLNLLGWKNDTLAPESRHLQTLGTATYNNTGKAALGVAVALQLLRNSNENTGGQSHVEDAVLLL